MKYLLGIDSGGTVTKAAIYDVEGKEIAHAEEKLEIICPSVGYNEREFDQFRQGNINVIRSVLQKSGVAAEEVAGIALTGQGNGLYLFDEQGNCIRRPVLSGDMRAKEYLKKWSADGTTAKIGAKTRQSIWAGQIAPLIAWFADNEPESLARAAYAVACKDYLRFFLTGRFCMEMSEASSITAMDLVKRKFDPQIFEWMGIRQYFDMLPPIVESTEIAGTVTKEAASLTGLAEGTPVVGGLFDIVACAIAAGVADSEKLSIVVGTWGINEYLDKQAKGNENLFLCCHFCLDDYYLLVESSSTSAVNLEWFIDQFMNNEPQADRRAVYENVNEMVDSVLPEECGIVFLPFLFGTNVNPDAKGAFVGLSGIHTRAHMLRAIYEGVVFCHKHHIERLSRYKQGFTRICISGGGSKSHVWVQMFADAMGIPVEVSGKTELGTMGAAMCAGVGIGEYQDMREAAAVFSEISKTVYPNPEKHAIYEKKYQLYRRVIDALDVVWDGFEESSKNTSE